MLKFLLTCLLLLLTSTTTLAQTIATRTPTPDPAAYPSITLTGHTDGVTALAWSPDGTILASAAGGFGSTDNTVRLWRSDGTEIATLTDHTAPVVSLAWSPDGEILASGDMGGKIAFSSPSDKPGTLIKMIDADAGIVFKLAWSPDGQTLASGSIADTTQNTVQWWSPDGSLIRTTTTAYSGGKFYNLGWSPDGKYLVGGASSYTEWRSDGTPVFSDEACPSCTPAWGFAWSPDSSRWAIGNESGNVTIYAVDGTQIASFFNLDSVDALAWSPSGSVLAGGSVALWKPDGTRVQYFGEVRGRMSTLVWSPDGKWLAAASGAENATTNNIFLWATDSPRFVPLAGHTDPVASLAWSPDGKMLASGSLDHTIRVWEIK